MRFPLLAPGLALAAVGLLSGSAHAATVTPVGQNRTVNLNAQASEIDGNGTPIVTDSDSASDVAVDFGPFNALEFVFASLTEATAEATASQDSEIQAQGIVATGSFSSTANAGPDGSASTSGLVLCSVNFTTDVAADLTVIGSIDAANTAGTTVSLFGPGLSLSFQSNAGTPHVDIDESVFAEAGAYTLQIRISGGAGAFRTGPVFSSAAFDVTLQFEDSAVDAPAVAAAGETGLRAVPNPFRASTRLITDLPGRTIVRAQVLDVTGRVVRSLAPASADGLVWDGRTDDGLSVPAGTYFVRLRSAEGERAVPVLRLR